MEELVYYLDDGQQVRIKRSFLDYISKELYYQIIDESQAEYVISQRNLEKMRLGKKRSKQEKLQLYMSYFHGRSDVYAVKWQNGKGYSPAIRNRWEYYHLRNNPEKQAQIVEYLPYTEQTVEEQILGGDEKRYGIYPLLERDQTYLLVLDFDNHDGKRYPKQACQAMLDTCRKYDINALPEVSSSGEGYHLWLFFSQAIPACLARKLGKLLLLAALVDSEAINYNDFDRMIPAQDWLPKGKGFGNLIALPLKWEDVRQGKSTFTDFRLEPLEPTRLFDYLEKTKRYSLEEVQGLVNKVETDVGYLQSGCFDLASVSHFPNKVEGYVDGQIHLKRSQLKRQEQVTLMQLATFANPEFIRKQAMRMPVWNVANLLTAASLTKTELCLPRGILPILEQACQCNLEERFAAVSKIKVKFIGKLRAQQKKALEACLAEQLGIVCAKTGFGKTVLAAAVIAKRQVPTLVIVPTIKLAQQWRDSMLYFLRIESQPWIEKTATGRLVKKSSVEIISGRRNHPARLIDIVTVQKLARMSSEKRQELFRHYGQVITDECHHLAAVTFEKILIDANVRYILGLSATLERKDGLEKFVQYRCGYVCYQSKDEVTDKVKRVLYPRYTSIGQAAEIDTGGTYAEKLTSLVHANERNEQIVQDIVQCLKEKRRILLLSERLEHLELLETELLKYKVQPVVLTGKKQMGNLENASLILATSKYVGEGFDNQQLDTLMLTLPFSWKGNTKQYLGRLERGLITKSELRVYDYIDISVEVFAKMYQKRRKVYRKMGYQEVSDLAISKYHASYYDGEDYRSDFLKDMANAKQAILAVRKLSLELILKLTDITRCQLKVLDAPANQSGIKMLAERKIAYVLVKELGDSYCLFDNKICWYGALNFLGKNYFDASVLRIVSPKLAEELESSM